MTIITISKLDKDFNNTFFFTTDHCQPHGLGEEWVSCTHYNTTREIVKEREENPSILGSKGTEIPNPQPEYQA